ncbi:hypothetical protein CXF86_18490 [Shewanella sp. GutCb]|jgi:hypothetical protein|uniref:hypothetical protein n=1 Tax=Shewanella sp. GutCb TaxID=2058315 RepID=UPI000C7B2A44|nr:hypothetical protein [Shewanella sp. GutCb]PKG73290.1 hypothetical protein CXF86_18490 [Shewanella sp. GutCb]
MSAQVINPLFSSLLLLSTVSLPAVAEQYRHIADPLNLSDSLYVGFTDNVLNVGGTLATDHQKFSANTNTGGDKWHLGYLYSSSNQWHLRASIDHGKTDTPQGKASHYQYQLGLMHEHKGWLKTQVFTEFAVNHLAVKSYTDSTAANASITVLKPITEHWYSELYARGNAGIDGVERFDARAWLAMGYQVNPQWSWVVRYQYDWEKLENIETDDTQWVFAVRSQF